MKFRQQWKSKAERKKVQLPNLRQDVSKQPLSKPPQEHPQQNLPVQDLPEVLPKPVSP